MLGGKGSKRYLATDCEVARGKLGSSDFRGVTGEGEGGKSSGHRPDSYAAGKNYLK